MLSQPKLHDTSTFLIRLFIWRMGNPSLCWPTSRPIFPSSSDYYFWRQQDIWLWRRLKSHITNHALVPNQSYSHHIHPLEENSHTHTVSITSPPSLRWPPGARAAQPQTWALLFQVIWHDWQLKCFHVLFMWLLDNLCKIINWFSNCRVI